MRDLSRLRHYCGEMETLLGRIEKAIRHGAPAGLLGILAIFHFSSMALMVLLSQYLGTNFFASISFSASDGHCDISLGEGVGIHCFGDYALISKVLDTDNPWQNEVFNVNYGAPTLLLFLLPKAIEVALASFDAGLFFYIGGMVAALSLPLVFLAKRLLRAEGGVLVFSIGAIVSGPLGLASIIALDRGNSVGFALPLLAWFAWSHVNGKHTQAAIAAGLALLIRPQFGLLLFGLLAARKFKLFFLTLGLSALSYLLSYLLFIEHFPGNIVQSIRNILSFGSLGGPDWPPNVSLARGLHSILPADAGLSQSLALGLIAFMLCLSIALPNLFRRADLAFLLLLLSSLASPVSWGYNLLFAQVAVFGIMWDYANRGGSSETTRLHSPSLAWAPGLVLSLVAFPSLFPPSSTVVLAPVSWLLSLAILTVLLLPRRIKTQRTRRTRLGVRGRVLSEKLMEKGKMRLMKQKTSLRSNPEAGS